MSFETSQECFRCPNYQPLFEYSSSCDEAEHKLEVAGAVIVRSAQVKCLGWKLPSFEFGDMPDDFIVCPAEEPRPPLVLYTPDQKVHTAVLPPVPQLQGDVFYRKVIGDKVGHMVWAPTKKRFPLRRKR
jgi:hypothetical protein